MCGITMASACVSLRLQQIPVVSPYDIAPHCTFDATTCAELAGQHRPGWGQATPGWGQATPGWGRSCLRGLSALQETGQEGRSTRVGYGICVCGAFRGGIQIRLVGCCRTCMRRCCILLYLMKIHLDCGRWRWGQLPYRARASRHCLCLRLGVHGLHLHHHRHCLCL